MSNELLNSIPVMDYEEIFELPKDLPSSTHVTAIGGSAQYSVVGTSVGTLHVNDVKIESVNPRYAITDISIDLSGDSMCVIAGETGHVYLLQNVQSPHPFVTELSSAIDYAHLPLNSVAICPLYSQSVDKRRIVIGGSTGDLIVLSQQGPPFSSFSVSKSGSKGPIVAVDWREDHLIWAGPDSGLKALHSDTNQRIGHLDLASSKHGISLSYAGESQWIINSGYRVYLVSIRRKKLKAETLPVVDEIEEEFLILLSVEVPMTQFAPNSELGLLMSKKLSRIVCFGMFDDMEKSLSLIAYSPESRCLTHHIIDTVKNDIPVSNLVVQVEASFPKSVVARYISGKSPFLLIGTGRRILKATKRSATANAIFLIDKGMYEEAIALSLISIKDESSKKFIANRVLTPLIEGRQFDRVTTLIPSLCLDHDTGKWSDFIDLFISLPAGEDLRASLAALVTHVPYVPRDTYSLEHGQYEQIIHAIVRNIEYSFMELLEVVRRWPSDSFDAQTLKDTMIDLVVEDFQLNDKSVIPTGNSASFPPIGDRGNKQVCLQLVLKHLYQTLERYSDALDILAKLGCWAEIFSILSTSFVKVTEWVVINLMSLFQSDAVVTSELLISHSDLFQREDILKELESHPFFLHVFLREQFLRNPSSTIEFHNRQVALFIEFDKPLLGKFLKEASGYDAEDALRLIAAQRKRSSELIQAEAVLQWKQRRFQEAINLMLYELKDISAAVRFASEVDDSEVWKSIQQYGLGSGGIVLKEYVEALSNVSNFSAGNALIFARGDSKGPGLIETVNSVVMSIQRDRDSLMAIREIASADYERSRSSSRHWSSATLLKPNTICRICGCAVVCLPPGGESLDDSHMLPESVPGLSNLPFHSRNSSSVLAIVSGRDYVHTRCLGRGIVDSSGS